MGKKAAKRQPRKRTAKKRPGRPTKMTPDRVKRLLQAAEAGMTIEGIARAGAIDKTTLYEWAEKYPEFSNDLMAARSAAEYRLVEATEAEDPKWLLERSYGYVKRVEVTGKDGDPLRVLVDRLQETNEEASE